MGTLNNTNKALVTILDLLMTDILKLKERVSDLENSVGDLEDEIRRLKQV